MDPATDRIALVTRRAGSKKVIDVLDRLLRAVRFDPSKKCLADAQTSAEEKEVAETVDHVLRALWQAAYGNAPTPDQLAGLLRLIWVQSLSGSSSVPFVGEPSVPSRPRHPPRRARDFLQVRK